MNKLEWNQQDAIKKWKQQLIYQSNKWWTRTIMKAMKSNKTINESIKWQESNKEMKFT